MKSIWNALTYEMFQCHVYFVCLSSARYVFEIEWENNDFYDSTFQRSSDWNRRLLVCLCDVMFKQWNSVTLNGSILKMKQRFYGMLIRNSWARKHNFTHLHTHTKLNDGLDHVSLCICPVYVRMCVQMACN